MSLLRFAFISPVRARCIGLVVACLAVSTGLANAQTHDGFQRRDGTMYLVRNGEVRPMTRDTHLPNGRIVTRDGFVVERDGKRTELAEGKGCTLLGQPAAIGTQDDGRLALFTGSNGRPGAEAAAPAVTTQFQRWFGGPGRGKAKGHRKKGDKHKRKDHDDED